MLLVVTRSYSYGRLLVRRRALGRNPDATLKDSFSGGEQLDEQAVVGQSVRSFSSFLENGRFSENGRFQGFASRFLGLRCMRTDDYELNLGMN